MNLVKKQGTHLFVNRVCSADYVFVGEARKRKAQEKRIESGAWRKTELGWVLQSVAE